VDEGIEYRENNAFVFKAWKVDTKKSYDQMLELDFSYWKIKKILKYLPG
jgi:hypothetical protein